MHRGVLPARTERASAQAEHYLPYDPTGAVDRIVQSGLLTELRSPDDFAVKLDALPTFVGGLVEQLTAGVASTPAQLAERAETLRKAIADGLEGLPLHAADRNLLVFALSSVRDSNRSLESLTSLLRDHPKFQGLAPENAWRVVLDKKAWSPGDQAWSRFENEPGYMAGMYRGLAMVLSDDLKKKPLDSSSLVSLHDAATKGVFTRNAFQLATDVSTTLNPMMMPYLTAEGSSEALMPEQDKAAFQNRSPTFKTGCHVEADAAGDAHGLPAGYPSLQQNAGPQNRFSLLPQETMTREGFAEAVQRAQMQSADFEIRGKFHPTNPGEVNLYRKVTDANQWDLHGHYDLWAKPIKSEAEAHGRMNRVLDTFRQNIRAAASEQDKLVAIAQCCQELEQAHPFSDGNARTFGFLLVNKLLLESDLEPAMIEDPNRFDGYSAAELAQEIRKGQAQFREICAGPVQKDVPRQVTASSGDRASAADDPLR